MAKLQVIRVVMPGLSAEHEFIVPRDMEISKTVALIRKILRNEYPEADGGDAPLTLLQASSGLALDGKGTLEDSGIRDGDVFILT